MQCGSEAASVASAAQQNHRTINQMATTNVRHYNRSIAILVLRFLSDCCFQWFRMCDLPHSVSFARVMAFCTAYRVSPKTTVHKMRLLLCVWLGRAFETCRVILLSGLKSSTESDFSVNWFLLEDDDNSSSNAVTLTSQRRSPFVQILWSDCKNSFVMTTAIATN